MSEFLVNQALCERTGTESYKGYKVTLEIHGDSPNLVEELDTPSAARAAMEYARSQIGNCGLSHMGPALAILSGNQQITRPNGDGDELLIEESGKPKILGYRRTFFFVPNMV